MLGAREPKQVKCHYRKPRPVESHASSPLSPRPQFQDAPPLASERLGFGFPPKELMAPPLSYLVPLLPSNLQAIRTAL